MRLSNYRVHAGAHALAAAGLLLVCGQALAAGSGDRANGLLAQAQLQAKAQPAHDHGLPFFDARLDANGVPKAEVTQVAARPAAAATLRARAIEALAAKVPGLAVDEHPLLGTPQFVRSTFRFLTPASPGSSPTDVTRSFVLQNRDLLEIDAREIDLARVDRDYVTDHNGARHLTFQQQIRGIDLFGSELRANVTRSGELINIASSMLTRPEGDFVVPEVKIADSAALVAAATDIGITVTDFPSTSSERQGLNQKRTWASRDFRSDEPTSTELVYFPLDRKTIHPAWSVVIPQKGIGHTYETLIDATDGRVLRRHNRLVFDSTQNVTLRAYTSDGIAPGSPGTPTPSGAQFPVVSSSLNVITPAAVLPFSPNGWITDGNQETLGNNVDAHSDTDNNNSPDLPRPNGGASRVFDFTYDPNQAPNASTTQRNASITQLFYFANVYHDRLYALGFNEAARNFQTLNFSGQGLGNDAVQADAQDGSGTNNANFGTGGADGTSARCQMYIFTGPTPDRDGSFDGDIVYHEMTHGTSIRLHGGLSGTQPGGMGEGWSDYYGISLLAEATDDPNAVYATGGYTTNLLAAGYTTNYYFGIRRFPYSTDLNKNPLTFADIDPGQISFPPAVPRSTVIGNTANEVHNVGEAWCMMLLECRAALWSTQGFAANQRMLQLVTDGMKLSAPNPTFIQARDAILQADQVGFGGADTAALWTAFAKRGLGFLATSPASSTTAGVVESFSTPQPVLIVSGGPTTSADTTGNGNSNGFIDPGESSIRLTIPLRNNGINTATITGTTLVSLTPTVTVPVASPAYPTINSGGTGSNTTAATISVSASHACGDPINLRLDVSTNGGNFSIPFTLGTGNPQFTTSNRNFVGVVAIPDSPNTTGASASIAVAGLPGNAGTVTFRFDGSACNTTIGSTTVGLDHTYLGDLFITLTNPSGTTVTLMNQRGGDGNNLCGTLFDDAAATPISGIANTGAPWTGTFRPEGLMSSFSNQPANGTWTLRVVDRGAVDVGSIRAFTINFRQNTSSICSSVPPACPVDINNDGVRTPADIFAFLNLYFAADPIGDFNNDGVRTPADIFAFLNAYFIGC